MKKSHWIFILFIFTLSHSACGTSSPTEVQIDLSEFVIAPSELTLPAGDAIFTIQNNGALEHDFVIEGFEDKSEIILPTNSETLELTLSPGTYTMICTVAGHKEAGMIGTIVVEER